MQVEPDIDRHAWIPGKLIMDQAGFGRHRLWWRVDALDEKALQKRCIDCEDAIRIAGSESNMNLVRRIPSRDGWVVDRSLRRFHQGAGKISVSQRADEAAREDKTEDKPGHTLNDPDPPLKVPMFSDAVGQIVAAGPFVRHLRRLYPPAR
ncbi:hypothetical protein AJ87_11265 [Rhizobium yanglingense]|nr:hypothetical protein AJ87_11265 [Rhizobium yanglingense]